MGKYQIFDEMIEGVQVIDQDWRYIYANEAVARHAKLSKNDLLGFTMMDKFPGIEKSDLFALLKDCMQKKQSSEWINEFDFPDGSKGYFELRIRPVEDGLLILSFDVTSQKRAEEIVKQSNVQLEELVEMRTKEILDQKILIEAQTEYLKELNEAKDKFFNIIAHDLRSPLHSLKGLSAMMVEGINHLSPEDIKKLSLGLQTSVDNALNLTDNLIEWATIQIQEFDTRKEKVELTAILKSIMKLYRNQAEKKNIDLVFTGEGDFSVLGDRNQINFILRNLLNNAIKFTKENGKVILSLSRQKNSDILVKVVDTGVGMSDDILKKIREAEFVESQDGTHGEKGTAMGLKLCFEFARLNEAKISIRSKPEKGTTFSLTMKAFRTVEIKGNIKRVLTT